MQLTTGQSRDLFAMLIGLVPLIFLLRNALREKPRNYVVIAGACLLMFLFSIFFALRFFPLAVPVLGLTLAFLALLTFVFAVASWSRRIANWKIVASLVLFELLLMYFMLVYGGPDPQGSLVAFLGFGLVWFFNGLVILGFLVGLILKLRGKRAEFARQRSGRST